MLFRQRNATDDRAALQARIVQLTAERDRLAENVRILSMELCERSIEYRDTRRALDSLLEDALDGPHNPI